MSTHALDIGLYCVIKQLKEYRRIITNVALEGKVESVAEALRTTVYTMIQFFKIFC